MSVLPAGAPSSLKDYQSRFTGYLRDPDTGRPPEGVCFERIEAYAELLYNKFEDSLLACFPITRDMLGADRWQRLVRDFIARHRCASPFYRQIPDEFVAYLRDEREPNEDPPCLAELAHHEWMELVLSIAPEEPAGGLDPEGDPLAGVPVFAPVLALLQYRHPVHCIGPEQRALGELPSPGATEVFILGFRDADDAIRFIEISAATARLVGLLREQRCSGREALVRLAEELRHPDCAAVFAFGGEILTKLRLQGAILGTETPGPQNSPNEQP